MKLNKSFSIWWGPPKEFNAGQRENNRRVSWLELFYDLVYVIAIDRITHHLSNHINFEGFIENICLFSLIFWGWLNGSLHHDLHGNQGLRTRLMMLWQMMIIAALAVILHKESDDHTNVIVIFMIMQLFITYQWWSVGIYDRSHRKYSWPYTIFFLVSFCLMGLSLWVSEDWLKFLIPIILFCNFGPPFIANILLKRSAKSLDLSSSMFERLGLLTIIIFGEVVIGVVNGLSKPEVLGFIDWLNFALGIAVVFALWWIFFVLISEREVKKGFDNASFLELLYIPALVSLLIIAASFPHFFTENKFTRDLQKLFGFAVTGFITCIALLMGLLKYPDVFDKLRHPMQFSLLLTAIIFFILSCINLNLTITYYLVLVQIILLIEIAYLNYVYYTRLLREGMEPAEV